MIADDCRNNRWSGRNARESYRKDNHTVIDVKYTTGASPPATKLKLCISEGGDIRDDANALRCIHESRDIQSGTTMNGHSNLLLISSLNRRSCFTEKDYMSTFIRIYKFIIYNAISLILSNPIQLLLQLVSLYPLFFIFFIKHLDMTLSFYLEVPLKFYD